MDICATDPSVHVVSQVEKLMMPSMSLWALMMGKFNEPLMVHLIDKLELYVLNKPVFARTYLSLLQMNLQFVFASILIHFREEAHSPIGDEQAPNDDVASIDNQLSRLNAYFHALQEKMNFEIELYKLDSILDDYLKLTKKYVELIRSDAWTSAELSNAFAWLNDKYLRRLIQMSAQVDAKDPLCSGFVKFFSDFILLFTIDFELIKAEVKNQINQTLNLIFFQPEFSVKIIPIFEKLLNVPDNESDEGQQALFGLFDLIC